jgi:uncharacterized protein YigE (DUF2233 family)
MHLIALRLILLAVVVWAAVSRAQAPAVAFKTVNVDGVRFDLVTVDLERADVRLSRPGDGRFASLAKGKVVALTNAGIFEPGRIPSGLFVAGGVEQVPLNRADGEGNFFMKPNGVFLIRADGTAAVVRADEYKAEGVREATQSGPLLLRRRELHSAFKKDSKNALVRSGVGVVSAKKVVFAISKDPVTFHAFARLFRDTLGCADALYLDGIISGLYAPELGRKDFDKGPFAGVIAVTAH